MKKKKGKAINIMTKNKMNLNYDKCLFDFYFLSMKKCAQFSFIFISHCKGNKLIFN